MNKISWLILCAAILGCAHPESQQSPKKQTMPEYDIIATHVVRQGETLDLIARQYYKTRYSDAAVERLVRCNMGLIVSESMGIIQPGMNLRIPSLREQEK